MPDLLAAALVFLTPVYFLLALWGAARTRADVMALAFGLVLGPPFAILVPQADLLLAGLIGGTAAYGVGPAPQAMSELPEPAVWGLAPIAAILLVAALPTHIWRWLGVLFAGRMDETSEVFVWVKAVATALVAALIAKLVLMPTGPLAALPVAVRCGAALLALAVYVVAGKRLAIGIAAGELALVAAWFILR